MISLARAAAMAAVLLVAGGIGPVQAQTGPFAKKEDAIKYRQSVMFTMSTHFGRLAAMANGRTPFDAAAAKENAELVATLSHLPWQGFAEGADGGRALPEIWKEQAAFKQKQDALQAETGKLAAATGSVDSLKAQVGKTGAACQSCHDDFRKR